MKRLMWCAGLAMIGAVAALAAPPDNPPKTDNPPKADNPAKTDNPPKADNTSAASDTDFVKTASAAGLAEINFGRLAAQQAANPDVRSFGQQMVNDHGAANDELNRIADKAGVTPSPAMDAAHQDLFKKLAGMRGADFDRAYIDSQVADHKDAVALFQTESKSGKNDDLKAFAGKTLPTIQHHLDMAQKLAGPEKPEKDKAVPAKDKETNPPAKDKESNPPAKDKETNPPAKDKDVNPPAKDKAPPSKDKEPPSKDK